MGFTVGVGGWPVGGCDQGPLASPRKLACHNLCTHLQPPKNYHSLLGLGLNFCPKPTNTTSLCDLHQVADHFSRDIYTQLFFAGSPDEFNPKQLFIRSNWEPDRNTIPIKFCARDSLSFLETTQIYVCPSSSHTKPEALPKKRKLLHDL
jgi:hypothetical protein